METPDLPAIPNLIRQLTEALEARRIEEGSRLLSQAWPTLVGITPETPGAGFVAGIVAEWIDAGFEDGVALKSVLARFRPEMLVGLPLAEYVQVRLAQAGLAMRQEDPRAALNHLDFILAIGGDLPDQRAVALANFWKARVLRQAGEYDSALQFVQKARDLAASVGLPTLAAVIQTQESWVLFQKGATKEAVRVLQEAEAALRDTDDFITLGNIQSAYGRIARREGRYEHAIRYFEASLDLFRHRPSLEGHYARSLANIAKAKRLLADELRRRMDADLERRQSRGAETGLERNAGKARDLERMRQLLEEAQTELAEADEIYRRFPSHHGSGNVRIGFSEIYLDLGHLDEADEAAAKAFDLGTAKTDYLLMCRARIAQASIANARYEEQISEREGPSRFAQLAYDCAREAVDFAEHTQSRRLLARAYACQGLVSMNGFFNNPELARSSIDRAEEYLSADRHGALWNDLQRLREKILRGGKLDPNLRAWSEGVVDGKSLQNVVEEFEAFLVSKVWERENRKVSRVAQRLSVSPKKVRRLLRRLGLLVAVTASIWGSPSKPNANGNAFTTPSIGSYAPALPAGRDLRLVTWNIDRGYKFDRVVSALEEKKPELCLLQEVDYHDRRTRNRDVARDLAKQLGYNYAFGVEFEELSQSVDGEPAYHGQATLSRWPIVKARILRFRHQSSWWKPHKGIPDTAFFQRRLGGRIALVTEISVGGTSVVVYNLHLESRSGGAIQSAQLDEVLADLKQYPPGTPAILGGDFNSKYHPFGLLHSLEGQGFRSVLGEKVERTHVLIGWLDWIFYRGPWQVERGMVVRGTHASDHDAILAELAPSPAARIK
jgi:endonuclease/exonuclease/phosphatase family metal-dependent hydrolase/tetratricopeptide (TPR) repeat protein